jgi:hypothetical protein
LASLFLSFDFFGLDSDFSNTLLKSGAYLPSSSSIERSIVVYFVLDSEIWVSSKMLEKASFVDISPIFIRSEAFPSSSPVGVLKMI